jgi:Dolichyl-phosphate-mannose-protein mannosyltransferase
MRAIKENHFFQKWGNKAFILAACIVYLIQAVNFAFSQRSIIDEGLYLYKGYLFARHIYLPFQEYGVWTQKAPLSYLFYGWIQLLFGPGLRTGRFFSIFIGAIALIGLWLVARRIGGRWWGTVCVWIMVINPVAVRYFSTAMSQSLVVCLLVWILFFTLGEERLRWQIAVGGVLTGVMVMTRQNMAPVLFILVAYIIWQHGWKDGAILTGACIFPLLVIHVIYWPNILKMWALYLPARLTPFLDPYRPPVLQAIQNQPDISAILQSLLDGFRYHFVALTGGLLALFFWPTRKYWRDCNQFRNSVFLAALFVVLLGIHAWAGLGNTAVNNNNVFTFSPYLAFFDFLGILVFISISNTIKYRRVSLAKSGLVILFLTLLSAGIGRGDFEVIGDKLATISLPRFHDFFTTFQVLPGKAYLWQILYNKYGIEYDTTRILIPMVVAFLAALVIILLGGVFWLSFRRRNPPLLAFASFIAIGFLFAGGLFTPTVFLGGGFQDWKCNGSTIKAFEESGRYLAEVIPPGSQVFWGGGNAAAVLLYVPEIRIFPPQLDNPYNYYQNGNSDELARYGYWNKELAVRWQDEADVFILQEIEYKDTWEAYVNTDVFTESPQFTQALNCAPDSYLRVFIRKP